VVGKTCLIRSVRIALALLGLAVIQLRSPAHCLAQDTLTAGDRIRVKPTIRPKDRVVGTLISLSSDTLAFDVSGDKRMLALPDLEYVQVPTGKKSHLVGTIAGVFTGALVGLIVGTSIDQATDDTCYEYCGLGGGVLGFLVGAVGGGIGGYFLLPKEEWVDVDLHGLRVTVEPAVIRIYGGR